MIVAIMSLEPSRLTIDNLGADLHDMVKVMKCTFGLQEREYRQRHQGEVGSDSQPFLLETHNAKEKDGLDQCLVGGGSYVEYTALKQTPQLEQYLKENRVVEWVLDFQYLTMTITNLSEIIYIHVLIINGLHNNKACLNTREVQIDLRSNLPVFNHCE